MNMVIQFMVQLCMVNLFQNIGKEKIIILIFFVTDISFNERWAVVFDEDGYADDEYYPNWEVDTVYIDWDTLEFNLNGKWIKYEVGE